MFGEITDESLFNVIKKYGIDYLSTVFDRSVYPEKKDLMNLKEFEEDMPKSYSTSEEILSMLHQYGSPATVSQVGGRYFGFVNGSVIPAGLFSRLLSDFWDQNTAMQVISPVSSKLEIVVEKWLKQIFNLPERTVAGFVSGTSMATFCGLAAARYRILKRNGWDITEKGLYDAPKIRIVVGKQAHSTVLKTISLLGLGKENVEWVSSDDQGRMISDEIPQLDGNTILILQAGNVNSGAFDDFNTLCKKANKAGAWVHIDGAFGLWAKAVKKFNHLTEGMEQADSWSVDGHKTLNTPYDNGIVLCEDKDALIAALHMTGSYIVLGDERDGMYYTPEMSRRARIVELWATMKFLGQKGMAEIVYEMHLRAKQFSEELELNDFEVLNDVCFNQVLVHYKNNSITKAILTELQDLRVCWCGGSRWNGKDVIRISVCSWATTSNDVRISVHSFIQARDNILKEMDA